MPGGGAYRHERQCHCLEPGDRAGPVRFAAANQLVGKTDDEVREALGDKFPKHIYHSSSALGRLSEFAVRPPDR